MPLDRAASDDDLRRCRERLLESDSVAAFRVRAQELREAETVYTLSHRSAARGSQAVWTDAETLLARLATAELTALRLTERHSQLDSARSQLRKTWLENRFSIAGLDDLLSRVADSTRDAFLGDDDYGRLRRRYRARRLANIYDPQWQLRERLVAYCERAGHDATELNGFLRLVDDEVASRIPQ
jgi:hypothetical protein